MTPASIRPYSVTLDCAMARTGASPKPVKARMDFNDFICPLYLVELFRIFVSASMIRVQTRCTQATPRQMTCEASSAELVFQVAAAHLQRDLVLPCLVGSPFE